jgi:PAS domain S-box-containing protein
MEHISHWQQKLPVQMVTTMIGLVVLTAMAIGIPALWVLRSQLESQAWELVNQGSQTSLALLDNRQSDLNNLAILTAQRPTLRRLVEEENWGELTPYLQTLQQGGGFDLLLLCSPEGHSLVQVGHPVSDGACLQSPQPFFDRSEPGGKALLLSAAEAHFTTGSIEVVVGSLMDERLAEHLEAETGFGQMLLFEGAYVTSSFPDGSGIWNGDPQRKFNLTSDGQPYFAQRVPFGETGFEWVTALPISDVLQARNHLTWMVLAGILAVVAVSSMLGLARSRRITQPLGQLRQAADDLRLGHLSRSIRVDTRIEELALLSYALEDARMAINHSLTELNREKNWTEHVLESVVEGVVTLDKRQQITFFSRGAEEITGWKAGEVLGQDIDEVFPLYDSGERFSRQLPQPGGKQKIVVRLRDTTGAPGRPATLAVTGAQLAPPEAGNADIALVLRDVSSEEAIRRLLGEFLANISHEFRTPLSALAASIELLLEQLPDLTQEEVQDLLNNIHLAIFNLQQLIDNLLEGASLETGRFQVVARPNEVGEIVAEAARLIQPLVAKYGLTLLIDCPAGLPKVHADFRRSVQVIVNLLSNAVKWSPTGSEIRLVVVPLDDRTEVCVSDQGPGISDELLPDLFHRFRTAPDIERENQGTGLGLSVVKAIIDAQGGQVGVRSQPGGGAAFWFTLCHAKIGDRS